MPNQYTATPVPPKGELARLYKSGLTQAELAQLYGVSSKVVFGWFRRLGIQSRVAKPRDQRGPNNPAWVGNSARHLETYHKRVDRLRGQPQRCEACGTRTAKKYEWANLTGRYTDVRDYKRMCASCHAKYDKKIRNLR